MRLSITVATICRSETPLQNYAELCLVWHFRHGKNWVISVYIITKTVQQFPNNRRFAPINGSRYVALDHFLSSNAHRNLQRPLASITKEPYKLKNTFEKLQKTYIIHRYPL